jgi:hypothetical protein
MKDYIKQLIADKPGNLLKTLTLREYLQARILQILQESGIFLNWVFHGGTALRFLYLIPRYSEDLDFSIVNPAAESSFRKVLQKIKNVFNGENYSLTIKLNEKKPVISAFLRFARLLYEMGLSPHQSQVVSVKIELDTNPPPGANFSTTIVRRHVTLNLFHHDKASLLAGKLSAILLRLYTKGRDLYDLAWYLSDKSWPQPNLNLLNEALTQSNWKGPTLTDQNWKEILINRLSTINWAEARKDVQPFLEREEDISLVSKEVCLRVLEGDR